MRAIEAFLVHSFFSQVFVPENEINTKPFLETPTTEQFRLNQVVLQNSTRISLYFARVYFSSSHSYRIGLRPQVQKEVLDNRERLVNSLF